MEITVLIAIVAIALAAWAAWPFVAVWLLDNIPVDKPHDDR